MLIKKKPVDDTKLKFSPMGAKPKKKADVEDAADAKKPGDKREDRKEKMKGKSKKKSKKTVDYAAKAAATIAGKK